MLRFAVALVLSLLAHQVMAAPVESFADFLRHFEAKAVAAGVSAKTYRATTEGLTPDPNIPDPGATRYSCEQ